jgi:malate dehydrogenase
MKKVSIIGSGNVGANAAFFVAEMAAAHVTLIDIEEGRAVGKALDLMEAAPVRRYRTKIEGSDSIEAIEGSDIVVLAAGIIREPGMDRTENFKENAAIVESLVDPVVKYAPDAKIIIAPEPVDAMVKIFVEKSGFDRKKVMGIGGILDSTRMASFIADELSISARDINAMVIGSHTKKMVPLIYYSRVSGIEISELLDEGALERIVHNTRQAGNLIVDLAKRSNAYYAPSSAIAQVVEAISIDTGNILPVSVLLNGEYGMKGVALSVPCKLGANGIEEIIELKLQDDVWKDFQASAEPIRDLS